MKFKIDNLTVHPQWIPILADWTYSEWGHFNVNNTLESTIERYHQCLNNYALPLMLVAHRDLEPIGCVSLKEFDIASRQQFSPWIASMFVKKEERGKGIGSKLLDRVVEESKRLEYSELYLWTGFAEEFYLRKGFKTIECLRYDQQDAKIMQLV